MSQSPRRASAARSSEASTRPANNLQPSTPSRLRKSKVRRSPTRFTSPSASSWPPISDYHGTAFGPARWLRPFGRCPMTCMQSCKQPRSQRADLVPLKLGLLAWASSVSLIGQYTPAPVATPPPPPLAHKGIWTHDQLRPLLECSVLPVRSGELLHQIELAGEHSWATAPTFALLQAGIPDTVSPPPLTPPSQAPYLTKGQAAPSPAGTLFATTAFTPASALYRSQDKPAPAGAEHSPASLLPEQTRHSFSLPEPASQVQPAAADPTPPESPAPASGSGRRIRPPQPLPAGRALCPGLGRDGLLNQLHSAA